MALEEPEVGGRARLDGDFATVLYVGPVDQQEGRWVGLQWDNAARGKHDGSVGGRRYFKGGAGACTFLRQAKYLQLASACRPVSIVEALKARYTVDSSEAMSILTASNRSLDVKLVGRQKVTSHQSNLQRLETASLAECLCSHVGVAGVLAQLVPSLEELDLSRNLFSCWADIHALATELGHCLRSLTLSCNVFSVPASAPASPAFTRLQTLVLNSTRLSWRQILALEPCLPGLQELHACECGLTRLDRPAEGSLRQLQALILDGNLFSAWADVAQCASISSLQRLSLSDNELADVQPPQQGQLSRLESLQLAGNRLPSWEGVNCLDAFPALRDLRLSGNPCLEGQDTVTCRLEVIARVGGLTRLNGSDVSSSERRDAEVRYLRTRTGEMAALSVSQADMAAKHPRLPALQAQYGHLGAAEVQQLKGTTMAAGSVQLQLSCPETSQQVTKRLPGSLTVAKLKVLVERLFRIPAACQRLELHEEGIGITDVSRDEARDLNHYRLQGTFRLVVGRADVAAAESRAEAASAQEHEGHERRMQQHQQFIDMDKQLRSQQFSSQQGPEPLLPTRIS